MSYLKNSHISRPNVGTAETSTSGGSVARSRQDAAAGQALLEVALMMPLLLLVSLAIVEFGRMLTIYSLASGAARQATRYGTAVDQNESGILFYRDCDGIGQAAQSAASPLLQLNTSDVTIQYDNGLDGSENLINGGEQCDSDSFDDPNALESGNRIRVTITTSFQPLVPLVNLPPMPITYISTRTIIKKGDISTFPECSDGVDNDQDSQIDWDGAGIADPDANCSGPNDNTEFAPLGTPECYPLFTAVKPGPAAGTATIDGPAPNCPPGFGAGYLKDTVVTVTADPADDWVFLEWTGGTDHDNDINWATTTVQVDQMKTVTAHFEECFELNVSVAPVEDPPAGSVAISDATTCPEEGMYRRTVTLTAEPAEDREFANWIVNGLPAGFDPVLTLTMDSDKTVVARFYDICFQVAPPSVDPAGSPNSAEIGTPPTPNCPEEIPNAYANGSTLLLGADPGLGWIFDGWTWEMGDPPAPGSSPDNPALLVVTGDVSNLTAHFSPRCYTLATEIIPSRTPPVGTLTVDPPDASTGCTGGQYPAGQLIELTASSATNPFFAWTVNGVAYGSDPSISVLMDSDKTVVARFEGKLHVASINPIVIIASGNRWFARVRVTVVDEYGAPASDVAVTGHWTLDGRSWSNDPPNPYNLTNGFGQVTFYSEKHNCRSNNPCTFEYTVTDLAKTYYAYDPSADQDNPASVVAPPP